jgi:hypothetical protein
MFVVGGNEVAIPIADVWKFMLHKHLKHGPEGEYRARLEMLGKTMYVVLTVGKNGSE